MITAPFLLGSLALASLLGAKCRDWPKLRGRKERTSIEFFQEFYRDDQSLTPSFVADVYEFIDENFGTMSRLVPTDILSEIEDAGKYDFDSDTSFLLDSIYRRLAKDDAASHRLSKIDVDMARVRTVDDIFKLLARYELDCWAEAAPDCP